MMETWHLIKSSKHFEDWLLHVKIHLCLSKFALVLSLSIVKVSHLHQAVNHVIDFPDKAEMIIMVLVFQMINVTLERYSWHIN